MIVQELQKNLPIAPRPLQLTQKTGLVIVDEIVGFARVAGGNLAPQKFNKQIQNMIDETNRLARIFTELNWPILAFQDCHHPGKEEPPYPPHCEEGTGEEQLVEELRWLEKDKNTRCLRKDCINGFIGSIDHNGDNQFLNWLIQHGLKQIIIVGICTDICVMDFVLTLLSARNHGMTGDLKDIIVYERACATYDLSPATAESLGLPVTQSHPQDVTHHLGLYFMASRGALLASDITLPQQVQR